MKIYAFIFTLSLFSIISNGVTQDPPKAFAPQAPSAPGGKYSLIKVYYSKNTKKIDGKNVIFVVNNVLQAIVVTPEEILLETKVQTFKLISLSV